MHDINKLRHLAIPHQMRSKKSSRPVRPRRTHTNTLRVLVVDNDETCASSLRSDFELEGFDVDVVGTAEEAEAQLRNQIPDLIIVDGMLPTLSGLELCQAMRARRKTEFTPIMILSTRGTEEDRLHGFEMGADDYIVKPFSKRELLARSRALLRRVQRVRVGPVLTGAGVELDRIRRRVMRGAREISLSPTDFRLLEFLMQRPGHVFSRAQLLGKVWVNKSDVDERTVDAHILRLRKALHSGSRTDPIRTVRTGGYAFQEET